MAETELAPCALCLQVFESPSMIEVQLPPAKGEPGASRRLCGACVSAIEAALPDGKRWESRAPRKQKAASKKTAVQSDPASVSEGQSPAPAQSAAQNSEGGEEVAKDA